jgi:hypothetical protein
MLIAQNIHAGVISAIAGKVVGYAVGKGVNEIRKAVSPAEKKTKEYEASLDSMKRQLKGIELELSNLKIKLTVASGRVKSINEMKGMRQVFIKTTNIT